VAGKGTKIEVEDKVSECYRLLCQGYARRDILHYAARNRWGKSDRAIDIYIQRAREHITEDARLQREEWLAEALARLRNAEREALALKQPGVAVQSIMAQAKLIGWKDDGAV
jgi:hypothetical protein